MIRGPYNNQVRPPAPFVMVSVCDPLGGPSADLPAQLDTAADRTVVPLSAVRALGMEPADDLQIAGFGGHRQTVPVYVVSLAVQTFPPVNLSVLAHPDEPWVLLGRDVLNHFRVVLDGPRLALEIA